MSTPQEVIDNVLLELERPDFNTMAASKLAASLRACHSIDCFRRDLQQLAIPRDELLISDGVGQFQLPPGFRKVWQVQGYNEFGHLVDRKFQDLRNKETLRDYFGVRAFQTFNIMGNTVTVSGISPETQVLTLTYLWVPPLTLEQGELTTDSWILQELPSLVEAHLRWQFAQITQVQDTVAYAQQTFAQERLQLLQLYVEDILGDPDV